LHIRFFISFSLKGGWEEKYSTNKKLSVKKNIKHDFSFFFVRLKERGNKHEISTRIKREKITADQEKTVKRREKNKPKKTINF